MENGIPFLNVGYLNPKDPQSNGEQKSNGGVGCGQGSLWQRSLRLPALPRPGLLWHVACQGQLLATPQPHLCLQVCNPFSELPWVFPTAAEVELLPPCSPALSTQAQLCTSSNSRTVFMADFSHRVIATSDIQIFPPTFSILKELSKYCIVVV